VTTQLKEWNPFGKLLIREQRCGFYEKFVEMKLKIHTEVSNAIDDNNIIGYYLGL